MNREAERKNLERLRSERKRLRKEKVKIVLDIFLYGNILSPWLALLPTPTLSTPWANPGGERS
jgi:hypothetical protein